MRMICLLNVVAQKFWITSGTDEDELLLVPVSSTAFMPNMVDMNDRGS
jgi:hypothetical protein